MFSKMFRPSKQPLYENASPAVDASAPAADKAADAAAEPAAHPVETAPSAELPAAGGDAEAMEEA